ncbi:hypothetical protein [Caballeronia sp. BR00000012568055]|uniref:hypothetical protein n=1 Tax=Caballeronia sp. BR00000012568055 TaxID=2918761 RepID=UPI0023F69B0A|nr:hypothetical protein [Caballeronia sp. BR00000012568055]
MNAQRLFKLFKASRQSGLREKDLEYAKEFWAMGNVVTGFAVVQSLAFLIAVGPQKGDLYCAMRISLLLARSAILIGLVLYLAALWFCHFTRNRLLADHEALDRRLQISFCCWSWGSTLLIVLFCLLSFAATCDNQKIKHDCDGNDVKIKRVVTST